ncbi:MAG: 3'-5' exonuclease [Burkholderiales bacterium]|nr:3'-5' exonuclease [Burkholderiales bacterium]
MASSPVLVFDIESIPDVAGLRLLRQMDAGVDDAAVYEAEIADRAARGKGDFMPLYLQRVLVISCVFRNAEGLRVHSLVDREGGGASQEGRIIQQFFNMIERHVPQLVSWNGSGFDLPVLHYRGMRHGVVASKYWDMGEDDREHRYNNYISRYHLRHVDLMDLLALYQGKANAPLDAMAKLCGFPGKLGMDGSQVFNAYRQGRTDEIRRYCETDVMNTYLLYCRFQQMRGGFTEAEYEREIALVRETLGGIDEAHWREYLAAWPDDRPAPPAVSASVPAEPPPPSIDTTIIVASD